MSEQSREDSESGIIQSARLRAAYPQRGGVRGIFTTKVADYSAARPDYPPALFEALLAAEVLRPEAMDIADIGAGTGLLTRALLARGHRVVAVEPNAAMREAADANLSGYASYRSTAGSAETTGLETGSMDLVTAAQAFHWFEPDAARQEFRRILRPAGQAVLIWNDRVLEDPLQRALEAVFNEFGGASRAALVAQERRRDAAQFFASSPPRLFDADLAQFLDEAGLLSLAFSRSYMPPRGSEVGERAAERLRALFRRFSDGWRVDLRYRTRAYAGTLSAT